MISSPIGRVREIFLHILSEESKNEEMLERIDEIEYIVWALLLYLEERCAHECTDKDI